ncbi:hypothetical protein ACN28G_08995 [Micromonospora sp. WMMA1923]|uniref:hypothetical protein n=1 Tax=Micromonospora sp. WMMA1923 TaxID=3404125 RepID=UPI003B9347EF
MRILANVVGASLPGALPDRACTVKKNVSPMRTPSAGRALAPPSTTTHWSARCWVAIARLTRFGPLVEVSVFNQYR